MSYKETLFTQYGSPRTDSNVNLRIFLLRPDTLSKVGEVERYDKSAASYIDELESYLAALREYRAALAARYSQLETMGYHDELSIKRQKWNTVTYFIEVTRIFEDGTEVTQFREEYEGRERSKALKRFDALKKSHPGVIATMDIEKGRWER